MHPSKDILASDGTELEGKNIAICMTGSVAAVRIPDLSRKLMRHGAEVRIVMSKMAKRLVGSDLLHWATGNEVITELTGEVEHVEAAKWADMIVVAPATANTIGKIANGIDDTPPTSVISVAQGLGRRIVVVPAMHASMYSHDIIQENLLRLEEAGFDIIEPKFEEGKAKIPSVEEMAEFVMNLSRPKDLKGKKILVTAGPTIEWLDPVRILTNRSSGKMGISIARAASARGAEVTLVYGPGSEKEPPGVETIRVETTDDMLEAVMDKVKDESFDLFVSAAAPQDFKPKEISKEKLRRNEAIKTKLMPTPSILDKVSKITEETFLIGFKAECDVSDDQLEHAARDKMEEHNLDMVVANDILRTGAGFGTETNDVVILSGSDFRRMKGTKDKIASAILDIFSEEY